MCGGALENPPNIHFPRLVTFCLHPELREAPLPPGGNGSIQGNRYTTVSVSQVFFLVGLK